MVPTGAKDDGPGLRGCVRGVQAFLQGFSVRRMFKRGYSVDCSSCGELVLLFKSLFSAFRLEVLFKRLHVSIFMQSSVLAQHLDGWLVEASFICTLVHLSRSQVAQAD